MVQGKVCLSGVVDGSRGETRDELINVAYTFDRTQFLTISLVKETLIRVFTNDAKNAHPVP